MLIQAAVLGCLSAVAAAAGPPNIILYVIDDLGFADLSLAGAGTRTGHGAASDYATPAIDRLASEGIMLDTYYVNRLCSPTRTSLLSSRYAYTLGLAGGVITNGFPVALRLNETTIADKLKVLGYQTHGFGKWDIGYHTWEHTPTYRGFDTWLGYYNADEDYFTHSCGGGKCPGGKALDFRNGTAPLLDNTTYSTHRYTEEGLRILADHDPSNGPFFIYAAYQALHGPLEAPQKYLDECPQVTEFDRHIFCGMAMALNEGIGNMTAMLERLGLMDNTIIALTTDNGGQNGVGGNNWPLRGNKATVFEGGVRGNGFVWGGASTKLFGNGAKGRLNTAMMHNVDWGPTFVAAAGGNASAVIEADKLDGLSIWPALVSNSFVRVAGELRGAIDYGPRNDVLLHLQGPDNGFPEEGWELTAALRMGDWKVVVNQKMDTCNGSMVNASGQPCLKGVTGWVEMQKDIASGKWATRSLEQPVVNQTCDDRLCLFNLRTDPFERDDVAALNPAVVARLVARIEEYNTTRIPNIKQPFDLKACPSNFPNDVWTPWLNSTPPLPGPAPPAPPAFLGSIATPDKWSTLKANTRGVSGWCCDPLLQNGTGPSSVTFHVTANGGATTQLGSQVANIFRGGVVAAGCASSNHGFDLKLDLTLFNKPGHKYLLYAVATRPASAGADTHHLISRHGPICFTGVTGAAC